MYFLKIWVTLKSTLKKSKFQLRNRKKKLDFFLHIQYELGIEEILLILI
jgi:hypothetical protein